jgi:hypothetical protein
MARTVIPFKLEDMRDLGNATVDDAKGRLIEIFREEISQKSGDGRADLGWFEQGWASGGYGADDRLHTEENGEIPGSITHMLGKRTTRRSEEDRTMLW